MERKFVTKEGKKVNVGDIFVKMANTPVGELPVRIIKVDSKSIPYLLKEGVIKEVTPEVKNKEVVSVDFFIECLAARNKWDVKNMKKYLESLYNIYPAVVFSTLLREIAIQLDKKYSNHISESEDIWVVSMFNGRITKVHDRNSIKNFRNFAAFRTLDDAIYAKNVLKDLCKEMFSSGK